MADNDGDSDEARTLRPLQAAACTYRIAFGPRTGQKVLTLVWAPHRQGIRHPSRFAVLDGVCDALRVHGTIGGMIHAKHPGSGARS